MLLMIDNYDSFTFNLVQYLGELGATLEVVRNDALTVEEALARRPDAFVISPGPCSPKEAGISVELIQKASGKVPLLGVCLGHQSIVEALGGDVVRAGRLMHGKVSMVEHDGRGILAGLSQPFQAGRYHSLIAKPETLPAVLKVAAKTAEGEIMAVRHRELNVDGVQFHPESVLTPEGPRLMGNFLALEGGRRATEARRG